MRACPVLLRTGVVLSLLTAVHGAGASDEFGPSLPNGDLTDVTCRYCHVVAPDLNVFGVASDPYTPADLAGLWPALCVLDTDGDGVTNGVEMGDPCCVWVQGGPAPQEPVASNPGDPLEAVETICDPGGTSGSTGATTGGTSGGATTGATASAGAGLAKPPVPVSSGACAVQQGGERRAGWGWIVLAAAGMAGAIARRRRR
jgi:hypothetical protein